MATFKIESNPQTYDQTFSITMQSGSDTDSLTVTNYGNPSAVVPTDYFPTNIEIGLGQQVNQAVYNRRHITIDLMPLGLADAVTVRNLRRLSDGVAQGKVRTKGQGKAQILLQDVLATDALLFDYTATKAGQAPIEGVASVVVSAVTLPQGWGKGENYLLGLDSNKRVIVTPGRNHRKVHVAVAGLSASDLATRHSVSVGTITAAWLKTTVAIGAGSDGTSKYGETPALALNEAEALKL